MFGFQESLNEKDLLSILTFTEFYLLLIQQMLPIILRRGIFWFSKDWEAVYILPYYH